MQDILALFRASDGGNCDLILLRIVPLPFWRHLLLFMLAVIEPFAFKTGWFGCLFKQVVGVPLSSCSVTFFLFVEDVLAPLSASASHVENVCWGSNEDKNKGSNLQSKIQSSWFLYTFSSTIWALFSISCNQCYNTGNSSVKTVSDSNEVDELHQINSDGSTSHDEGPFEPFNDMENCWQENSCVEYSTHDISSLSRIVLCNWYIAIILTGVVGIHIDTSHWESKMVQVDNHAEADVLSPSLLDYFKGHLGLHIMIPVLHFALLCSIIYTFRWFFVLVLGLSHLSFFTWCLYIKFKELKVNNWITAKFEIYPSFSNKITS